MRPVPVWAGTEQPRNRHGTGGARRGALQRVRHPFCRPSCQYISTQWFIIPLLPLPLPESKCCDMRDLWQVQVLCPCLRNAREREKREEWNSENSPGRTVSTLVVLLVWILLEGHSFSFSLIQCSCPRCRGKTVEGTVLGGVHLGNFYCIWVSSTGCTHEHIQISVSWPACCLCRQPPLPPHLPIPHSFSLSFTFFFSPSPSFTFFFSSHNNRFSLLRRLRLNLKNALKFYCIPISLSSFIIICIFSLPLSLSTMLSASLSLRSWPGFCYVGRAPIYAQDLSLFV